MNTPDSINKKVSLKDLKLDSIILDCDVVMWAHYYQLIINDSNAILQGCDFGKNNWEQPVELSNKDRNSIINYIDEFYVSKTHNIIAKKYKTGEYVEGDFTQITITVFRKDGSKDEHKIDTHSIQNGYWIEFSKDCYDFLDLLHVLAGRYSYPKHYSYRSDEGDEEDILHSCEYMPRFPGGDQALMKFIKDNMVYPPEALKNKIEGKVIVQFVVTKTGKVGKVKVARPVNKDLDREAVRLCKMLPNFYPGRNAKGEPVNVWYTLPVTFKLPANN